MALAVQSQDQFQQELTKAGDKPVVMVFTPLTRANIAITYSDIIKQCGQTSEVVFLMAMLGTLPGVQEIADEAGVGDEAKILFYQKGVKVTSFEDEAGRKVQKCLQEKLPQLL
ncbi:unnamed protein product [Ophioblennius macclurei]